MSLFATIGLNYYMFRYQMTYGLFPVQDTGLIIGAIQADQSISFQAMKTKFTQLQDIVQEDPAVDSVGRLHRGPQTNSGFLYSSLKPYAERKVTADEVVARLRPKLAQVAGARLYMFAVSDLRTGGRQSNSAYQYTLLSDDPQQLYAWAPKLTQALTASNIVKDVNSDQQLGGLQTNLTIDRDTAMRLGLTISAIDDTALRRLRPASVSTIYNALNQYHVVMEIAPALLAGSTDTGPRFTFRLRAPIRPRPNRPDSAAGNYTILDWDGGPTAATIGRIRRATSRPIP